MSLLLLLVALGGVFTRRFSLKPKPDDHRAPKWVAPTFEPGRAYFNQLREATTKRAREPRRTSWKVARLIAQEEYDRIKTCCASFLRFHHAKSGDDVLLARRCYHWLCPACADVMHYRRTMYVARKIASLNPDPEPLPRLVNVVFTLPPIVQSWLREDPRVHPAWRRAIRRTIARVYRYEGKHGANFERACWQEMGALMTLHAWGSESWPKFHPHYDVLIPAWKRKGDQIKPLRETWPERYQQHTSPKYRQELRAALLPLAQRPFPREDLLALLKTDFDVDWHMSKPPPRPGAPKGNVVHTVSALHRIRYNVRPMWHGGNAWINTTQGKEELVYELDRLKRGWGTIKRVPLGPGVGLVRCLKPFLTGSETRRQIGIMSRVSYAQAARLAGHEPIKEREERGLALKAHYERNPDGHYEARPARARRHSDDADA